MADDILDLIKDSDWKRLPLWKKRMSGFICYFIFAFVALLYPIEADLAIYKTLKDQFLGDGK